MPLIEDSMEPKLQLYVVIIFIGICIYLKKPSLIMIYWLSLQPIIMPLYLSIFSYGQSLEKIYFSYSQPASYLFLLLFVVSLINKNKDGKLHVYTVLKPVLLLSIFLVIQGLYVYFHVPTIVAGVREILFLVLPLLLLILCPKMRPKRQQLINYLSLVTFLQVFFCLLSIVGFKVYNSVSDTGGFESTAIAGTFMRYNHMTNYLTTNFLVLTIARLHEEVKSRTYIINAISVGTLVLFSGAKLSLVLYAGVLFSYLFIHNKKNAIKIGAILIVLWGGVSFLGKTDAISQTESANVSGLERNISGLAHFYQSMNDIDGDDSTVGISTMLLMYYFNNPIIGNGEAYKGDKAYNIDWMDKNVLLADARFAYMLVEYGIIGVLLYFVLFYSIFKIIKRMLYQDNRIKLEFVVVVGYYFIFTITESGLFDATLLSMLYIYAFSNGRLQMKIKESNN